MTVNKLEVVGEFDSVIASGHVSEAQKMGSKELPVGLFWQQEASDGVDAEGL